MLKLFIHHFNGGKVALKPKNKNSDMAIIIRLSDSKIKPWVILDNPLLKFNMKEYYYMLIKENAVNRNSREAIFSDLGVLPIHLFKDVNRHDIGVILDCLEKGSVNNTEVLYINKVLQNIKDQTKEIQNLIDLINIHLYV